METKNPYDEIKKFIKLQNCKFAGIQKNLSGKDSLIMFTVQPGYSTLAISVKSKNWKLAIIKKIIAYKIKEVRS